MVVMKLKRERGRPESEKVDLLGVRKKERFGEGRVGLYRGFDRATGSGFGMGVGMQGRRSDFVDGVFCSLDLGRCGFDRSGFGPSLGDNGDEANGE
jgi:hypothetical protein